MEGAIRRDPTMSVGHDGLVPRQWRVPLTCKASAMTPPQRFTKRWRYPALLLDALFANRSCPDQQRLPHGRGGGSPKLADEGTGV
jgi:hypothetical protein